jgi:patatin-like phospholipase/acyl hydrolase
VNPEPTSAASADLFRILSLDGGGAKGYVSLMRTVGMSLKRMKRSCSMEVVLTFRVF